MPRPPGLSRLIGPTSPLASARHGSRIAIAHRHASTYQSAPRRFLSTTLLLGGSVALVAYYDDSRSLLHEHVVMPLMRLVDPETGHRLAVRFLSGPRWTRPRDRGKDGPELQTELFGIPLVNPVGIAAGFDKDAQAIDGLFDLGFGYVEVGSVTPEPQPGNPGPRFFRLEEDSAAINRYGFNSLGHGHTLARLKARVYSFALSNPSYFSSPTPSSLLPPPGIPRSLRPGYILAVNLGKNKISPANSNEDYIKGVRTLGPYADVVVINVSSPNTPGLRALQGRRILEGLLREVVEEREKIKDERGLPKIAVKVACDLSEDELGNVAWAVKKAGVEGVIVSNTTIRREGLALESRNRSETGGLSGRPLFPYALNSVRTLRSLLPSEIPVIGCGGVSTGRDAVTMAKAGADIVQIYTSFGYRGVGTPRLLKDEISASLRAPATGSGSSRSIDPGSPGSRSTSPTGSTWKSIVGSDPRPSSDQDPLKAGQEALRREAHGLGEMLRRINEEESTRRLVEQAEAALKGLRPVQETHEVQREHQEGNQKLPVEHAAMVLDGAPQATHATQALSPPPSVPLLVFTPPEPVQSAHPARSAADIEGHGEVVQAILETGHDTRAARGVLEQGHEDGDDHWRENVQSGERRIV